MKRLGQSGLEFLMTYGWAMLLIIVAGVIAYQMGLFSIGGRVEPGSSGFWGLVPTDFKFSSSTKILEVSLTNNVGASVTLDPSTYAKRGSGSSHLVQFGGDGTVASGESKKVSFQFDSNEGGASGDRVDVLMTVVYTDSRTGKSHSSSGKLWGAYEE